MDYISVTEFAKRYGIAERTARNNCAWGKIDGTAFIGISQRAATYFEGYTNVCQFVSVSKQRSRYLTQRIKALDYGVKHYNQVNSHRETFCIVFSTLFATNMKNYCLVKQIYYLWIQRLSDKMCTFAHGYYVVFSWTKVTTKGWNLQMDSALFFYSVKKVLSDTNN